MGTVNKVMIMGNLTRDPELRYTPQGMAVCDFALALNNTYRNKQGQEVKDVTFVDITAWSRTAEIVAEHVKKGRSVFVEGRLKQDRWDAQDGSKRSKLKIIAERVTFVGPKGDRGPGAPQDAVPEPDAVPPPEAGEDIPF